jgi:hypothetical protein
MIPRREASNPTPMFPGGSGGAGTPPMTSMTSLDGFPMLSAFLPRTRRK